MSNNKKPDLWKINKPKTNIEDYDWMKGFFGTNTFIMFVNAKHIDKFLSFFPFKHANGTVHYIHTCIEEHAYG